jgi:hypothetical protein
MTNLDALKAVVGIDQISANSFTKALLDASIDPAADYSSGNKTSIDNAGAAILKDFLQTSVSEGGYSVTYDRKAIEAKISQLSGAGVRGVQKLNI